MSVAPDRAARPAADPHRSGPGDQRAGPPLAPDPRGRSRAAPGRRHRLRRRPAAARLHPRPAGRPTPRTTGSPTRSTTRSAASRARSPPGPARSRPAAAPRSRWPRRSCTWSTSPTRPRTSGWPARPTYHRQQREILDDLVDARLVVINEVNDQQVYAPAHESLFSAWPPLVELIERRRDDLVLRSRLERRAGDWREGGAHPVRAAVRARARTRPGTGRPAAAGSPRPTCAAYVAASGARQRLARLVRMSVTAVVAVLVAALVIAVLVNSRSNRRLADTSKRLATNSRVDELAAIALAQRVRDPVAAAIAAAGGTAAGREVDSGCARRPRSCSRRPARDVLQTDGATVVAGGPVALTAGSGDATVWDLATRHEGRHAPGGPGHGAAPRRPDRRGVGRHPAAGLRPRRGRAGGAGDVRRRGERPGVLARTAPCSWRAPRTRSSSGTCATRRLPASRRPGSSRRSSLAAAAVLDDGTVLASSDDAFLSAWAGLDGGRTTVIHQLPVAVFVNDLQPDDGGSRALVTGPAVNVGSPLIDLRSGRILQSFQATDGVGIGAQLASTWTVTMDREGKLVAAFDLTGRGYVFSAKDGSVGRQPARRPPRPGQQGPVHRRRPVADREPGRHRAHLGPARRRR